MPVTNATKIQKLADLIPLMQQGKRFELTRLTSLKTLCQKPAFANRLVLALAKKTLAQVEEGKGRTTDLAVKVARVHREQMASAVQAMEAWGEPITSEHRRAMHAIWDQLIECQNEQKRVKSNVVRVIFDLDLLIVEDAAGTYVNGHVCGPFAYLTASRYAEQYDPDYDTTGLSSASVPFLEDIVNTLREMYPESNEAPKSAKKKSKSAEPFTARQGQFLAFLHLFRKLHRQSPSETEISMYFRITPAAVHMMIVKLEDEGLINREPGIARSTDVLVSEADLPVLELVPGPPW